MTPSELRTADEHVTVSDANSRQRINMLWETTQCIIAIAVVFVTMATEVYMVFTKSTEQIPTLISMGFGTVVGFYFGRTNHARPTLTIEKK